MTPAPMTFADARTRPCAAAAARVHPGARTTARVGLRGAMRTRVRAAAVIAGVGLLLTGCALRVETPPPPMPVPDAVEVVRDRTAEDAATLAELATVAAESAEGTAGEVLAQIASDSREHLAAVGGVYEPFPDATPEPTATSTESPLPALAPDAAAVLDRLNAAAATARTDADAVPDGAMARLLASVAANRLLLGEALVSSLSGADVTAPEVPDAGDGSEASTAPDPPTLPAGLATPDVVALVLSEDAAGMVWEVAAARSADAVRQQAADRAALHRHRAQAWAELAGIAGTADDPRRSAYDLPDAVIAETATPEDLWAAVRGVEAGLAGSYTSLVASAEAGSRGDLIAALVDCLRQVVVDGDVVPTFPGMPERA